MCTLTSEKVWRIRSFIFRLPPLSLHQEIRRSSGQPSSPPRLSVCHGGVIWFSRHFTFVLLSSLLLAFMFPLCVCVCVHKKKRKLIALLYSRRTPVLWISSVCFFFWCGVGRKRNRHGCTSDAWLGCLLHLLRWRSFSVCTRGINRRGSLQAEDGTTAV